jgi:hypothetical protein
MALSAHSKARQGSLSEGVNQDKERVEDTMTTHDWTRVGGRATGMSGGSDRECKRCGWIFSTYSSVAPGSNKSWWVPPVGQRQKLNPVPAGKDFSVRDTDPCPHVSEPSVGEPQ